MALAMAFSYLRGNQIHQISMKIICFYRDDGDYEVDMPEQKKLIYKLSLVHKHNEPKTRKN